MLKEQNNCNFGIGVIIISFVLIWIFPSIIFVLIFIFFKTDINFEKVLRKLGLYNCFGIEKIIKDIDKNKIRLRNKSKIKSNNKINNNKSEKDFFDLLLDQAEKNKRDKEKQYSTENAIKNIEVKETVMNSNTIKYTPSRTVRKTFKKSYSNKDNNYGYKQFGGKIKEKKYDFNGGKSIWDDYESVIDKMNKK